MNYLKNNVIEAENQCEAFKKAEKRWKNEKRGGFSMFLEWKPTPEQMEIMIEDTYLIDSGTLDQAIQSVKQEKIERREQRC